MVDSDDDVGDAGFGGTFGGDSVTDETGDGDSGGDPGHPKQGEHMEQVGVGMMKSTVASKRDGIIESCFQGLSVTCHAMVHVANALCPLSRDKLVLLPCAAGMYRC